MATYIYCRVSKEEQVHGCEVQEDLCRKTCVEHKLDTPIIIADDGVSTSKVPFAKRPGIIKLLSLLKEGDHVVVWRLDRLERGFLTFIGAVSQIVDKGVWIHSVEEKNGKSLDLSSALGRAMLAVWAIAADFYRETVQENTKRALQWRKEMGRAYTCPPFGFKIQAGPIPLDGSDPIKRCVPISPGDIHEIVTRIDAGELPYHVANDFRKQKRTCRTWDSRKNCFVDRPWVITIYKDGKPYQADQRRVYKAYKFAKRLEEIEARLAATQADPAPQEPSAS